MLSIVIKAKSFADLAKSVHVLSEELKATPSVSSITKPQPTDPSPSVEVGNDSAPPQPKTKTQTPAQGKRSKTSVAAKPVEVEVVDEEEETEEPEVEEAEISDDAIREALGTMSKVMGAKAAYPKAIELLKKYGVEKIADVPQSKRAAFIAAANKITDKHEA